MGADLLSPANMLRVGQSARLLARLQSVAEAIEGSQQPCSIISDALRLAARSVAVQAAPSGGAHIKHGMGHSGSCHVASSGAPARSFASEAGSDQTKDASNDQPSHYERLEAMYRTVNRDPLTGFIGRCGLLPSQTFRALPECHVPLFGVRQHA